MTSPSAPVPTAATDAPLSLPLYGATFGQAFRRFWKKYATFTGRASRSEFWWWYLANVIIIIALYALIAVGGLAGATYDPSTGTSQPGPLIGVGAALLVGWWLAIIVPTLAVSWRRLHDTNKSGAFWFLGLIPGVGGIILIVLLALDSDPEGRRFDV